VTVLEEQQETVCQMYGLMETYAVPAPAEDFALYATLRASVAAMQSAVDRSVEERDANVDRFCGCLRKDIVELNQEVKTVKQKAQVRESWRGLPPNSAVPRLKGNVDAMRDKLPVITDLHNPCLKPRHWEALERVVDASLTDEPLSLTVLERLDVFSHAAEIQEVVLTIAQMMWCRDLEGCLEGDHNHFEALQEFEITNFERLNVLAALVRGPLPSLHRNIITALITVDVHARDIVTDLIHQKVDSSSDFEWQRQLRYYWDLEQDNCIAAMALSTYVYGYEYLGACPRLVITPLTPGFMVMKAAHDISSLMSRPSNMNLDSWEDE
ncbi:hypothetical protein CRUP_029059, partial [Coryphaenoides rupestris]